MSKPSTSRGKLLVQLLQLLLLIAHLGKYCFSSSPMVFMLLLTRRVDKQRETYIKSFLSEASCKLPKLRVLRWWCRHPQPLSFFLQRIPRDSFTSSFSFCVLILFLSSKCPICWLSHYMDYPVFFFSGNILNGDHSVRCKVVNVIY